MHENHLWSGCLKIPSDSFLLFIFVTERSETWMTVVGGARGVVLSCVGAACKREAVIMTGRGEMTVKGRDMKDQTREPRW